MRGPLNTRRSSQGRPVSVQAGACNDGRAFAAQFAEAIFTAHQTQANTQAFYTDIKARAADLGRDPTHIVVLPGISPYIGSTEAKARRLHEALNALTQTTIRLSCCTG